MSADKSIDRDPRATAPPPTAQSQLPALRRVRAGLIADWHRGLLAIVYIRQSTPQQILDHRESRERQYELVNYAVALGWPRDRVLVIDDDQGLSGTTADSRNGFQRMLAEVTMEHVGLIVGIEMSRLARSGKDWHQLLEICAIFGTILADEHGLYDPRDPNDRLLLGLKGTMSEHEIITMRHRLEGGKLHKAERGELIINVPCGYIKLPSGEAALDPDEQVRATVQLVFDKFDELGSFMRLFRYLSRNKIRMGTRVHQGPRRGQLEWRIGHAKLSRTNAPSSDLCRSLQLRASPRGPQTNGFERSQGQVARNADVKVDRPPAGPSAGLHHLGALRDQPRAAPSESLPTRLSRGASHWEGTADGTVGLRCLWPTHASVLPQ